MQSLRHDLAGRAWRMALTLTLVSLLIPWPTPLSAHDIEPDAGIPMEAGGPARTGEFPGPGPAGDIKIKWQQSVPGKVHADLVATEELLLVGQTTPSAAVLLALDQETGEERWRYEVDTSLIWSSAAVSNGIAFIGTGLGEIRGALHAIHIATGRLVWEFPTDAIIGASPVVSDGKVVFGTEDGTLYALNALTGDHVWTRHTSKANRAAPAVVNGVVYTVSNNGTLYARDLQTGQARWQFTTGGALWPVAVADGLVFVDGFESGTLFAIDAETGEERWQFRTGGIPDSRGVAVSAGVAYAFVDGLTALDATTGEVLWSASLSANPFTTPVIAQGVIYLGSLSGDVIAFDTATRSERWQFTLEGGVNLDPLVLDGVVYVWDGSGVLSALWTPPG